MEAAQAITEGAVLSGYKFTEFKTKKDELFDVEKVTISMETKNESETKGAVEGVRVGTIYANAQNYARTIDERPANIATPMAVAEEAQKDQLKKMNMGGILGVAQASVEPPCLIKLEYNKNNKKYPLYCVVGKGVTFDTGGISIKPSRNMHEMKYDKTGAVNVLGIMKAVSELKLPIRLLGIMAMVENMPSGSAQRPGDIVKTYNGKTIEVLNTDAEGRMILADALAYAAEQKPEYMIDMATLTGAMIVSLGRHAIGIFTNDDKLATKLNEAGESTYERVWRMPLWPEYGEMMKAEFADLKNISEIDEAGSLTAAAFLKEFVGETKWAHLDIAAVDTIKWNHDYMGKGATCTGVRLVTQTLARMGK
ncbi:leucyl aminopeptidase [Candidatus Micrarchaeota archaeon]|nr:leucyl aminopeptidase [Candidatus Micrarchaeota archaeon]